MAKRFKIFLSYSWSDIAFADHIDNVFMQIGIPLSRDTRDINYKDSIPDFMNQILVSDYVIYLISESFLQSSNCMYEALTILNDKEMERKILPVILPNTHIFNASDRVRYLEFWEKKNKDLTAQVKNLNSLHGIATISEELEHLNNIRSKFDLFTAAIIKRNCLSYSDLKESNYSQILELIGYKDEQQIINKIIYLKNSGSRGEQDAYIKELINNDPNNEYALFTRAQFAKERKEYLLSKTYYEEFLHVYPENEVANNNYANLLTENFDMHEKAKSYFETALKLNPEFSLAHNNLALLYLHEYQNHAEAKKHFELAIKFNPTYINALINYGEMQIDVFENYKSAKIIIEKVLNIEPNNSLANSNYGNILHYYGDENGSIQYYQKAIEADETNAAAHYGLANVLNKQKDFVRSKIHYERAIELNEDYSQAHSNYANLLVERFDDFIKAKKHYEIALALNSTYADAYFNYGLLLSKYFHADILAMENIKKAVKLDPSNAKAHFCLSLFYLDLTTDKQRAKDHYIVATRLDKSLIDLEYDKIFDLKHG